MIFFYNIFIQLYSIGIWVTSFFNPKSKKLWEGRRSIFDNSIPKKKNKRVWIHCASLGEFEQGRPIIELLKSKKPNLEIFLTFFSPSGYEIRKNYQQADYISYLPADSKSKVDKFINQVDPDLVIFIKYEFWYHFLTTLKARNIPTYLCSGIFRKEHFDKFLYASLFKKMVHSFDKIFVQNNSSLEILTANNVTTGILNGDTRIDRVLQIQNEKKNFPKIKQFSAKHKVFIIGSSWPKDEKILIPFINNLNEPNWKFIIAPHNIDEKYIAAIQANLTKKNIRFSNLTEANFTDHEVLIIDNIGMLSSIYQYGDLAYIGGGFGSGIHNTLEPAAFQLPIIIGPNYQKFEEANILVDTGGIFVIESQQELTQIFTKLLSQDFYDRTSATIKKYMMNNKGATIEIVEAVMKELL